MLGMSEKTAPLWLKLTAVITATALAGGFVAYRTIHANQVKRVADSPTEKAKEPENSGAKPEREMMSSSKSTIAMPYEQYIRQQEATQREIISSSKSIIITPENIVPKEKPARMVLSGSKSAILVPPSEDTEKEPDEKKQKRLILSGSKSGSVIDPSE